jgi:hypothetical protein
VASNTAARGAPGLGGVGVPDGQFGAPGGWDGGGIRSAGTGTLNVRDSILAENYVDDYDFTQLFPSDLSGRLSSSGYNLIGDTRGGSGFSGTDILNVDPRLGPLHDNGGPTPTMALLPGSPALNAGDPADLGTADQRGVARSGGVNIGAYQASASAFVLTVSGTPTAGAPFDLTVIAVDLFGQTAVGYIGRVTFATDDPNGSVPADYTFTTAGAGSHTFVGGVTLYADGSRVTVTDTTTDTLTGSIIVPLG